MAVAVPSDPAQTPVRPVRILSFDPYHLCSFRALSLSPVLSKQFKNLKSQGTVPSSHSSMKPEARKQHGGSPSAPPISTGPCWSQRPLLILIRCRLFRPLPWVFQISLLRSSINNIPQQSGPHCCLGDGEIFIVSGNQVEMQMVVFQHPNKIRGDNLLLP